MANSVLKVMCFQIFIGLLSGSHLRAQNPELIYNYNRQINHIASELRAKDIPNCNTNLLSISNILMNYSTKEEIPERLLDFLLKENVVNQPENKGNLKRDLFLVARYTYSNNYNSYLLMVIEENTEDMVEMKDLYLINITRDMIISLFRAASYYKSVDGYHFQRYSIYQGKGRFRNVFESITSDVEIVPENEMIKQDLVENIISINRLNGKAEFVNH